MIGLDKKWLIFVALMLVAQMLFASLACAADWHMFGHDPQHTGVAGESVEPPLEILWKSKTNNSVTATWAQIVYALNAGMGWQEVHVLKTSCMRYKISRGRS